MKNGDFFHDTVDVIHQLVFVKHFDCNLKIWVVLVIGEENATEGAGTENLSLRINLIIPAQLSDALLLATLANFDDLAFHRLYGVIAIFAL